jgi:hypothetical protein
VEIPHPGLIAIVVVVLGIPVAIWVAGWVSRALARYDARASQVDRDLVTACVGTGEAEADALATIEMLAHEEIGLIREILDTRAAGGPVTNEQAMTLRRAHRRGLAARQRCGDPALEAELGWLQGYGSLALMADLDELDRSEFERDLDHRCAEVRRALALRRMHIQISQT